MIETLLKSRPNNFLLAPIFFCVLSWLKYFTTGSVQVDDNFFQSEALVLVHYLISLIALIYSFYLFYRLYSAEDEIINCNKTSYQIAFICFVTLPMFSSDIFSILSFGTNENFMSSIYSSYHLNKENIYYNYVYKLYRDTPCVYGPLNLIISKLSQLSEQSVLLNLFAIKLVFLAAHIALIKLFELFARREILLFSSKLMKCLSVFPLIWFQGFMQLHNDGIALVFCIIGVYYLFLNNSYIISSCFFALAIGIKINFIFILGFFAIYFFDIANSLSWKHFLFIPVIILSILVTLYFPFIHSISELLAPISEIQKMGTHGSIKDLLMLCNSKALLKVFDILLALLLVGIIVYRRFFKLLLNCHFLLLMLITFIVTLYAHRFFPWYLIIFIPILIFQFENQRIWWRWFVWISLFYCLQDLSVQIPHRDILFQVNVGVASALGWISIFIFSKKRFFH